MEESSMKPDASYMAAWGTLGRWPAVAGYVWSDEARGMKSEEVVAEIKRRWPEAHEEFMLAFGCCVKKEGVVE
jgi:hypothetical protein